MAVLVYTYRRNSNEFEFITDLAALLSGTIAAPDIWKLSDSCDKTATVVFGSKTGGWSSEIVYYGLGVVARSRYADDYDHSKTVVLSLKAKYGGYFLQEDYTRLDTRICESFTDNVPLNQDTSIENSFLTPVDLVDGGALVFIVQPSFILLYGSTPHRSGLQVDPDAWTTSYNLGPVIIAELPRVFPWDLSYPRLVKIFPGIHYTSNVSGFSCFMSRVRGYDEVEYTSGMAHFHLSHVGRTYTQFARKGKIVIERLFVDTKMVTGLSVGSLDLMTGIYTTGELSPWALPLSPRFYPDFVTVMINDMTYCVVPSSGSLGCLLVPFI